MNDIYMTPWGSVNISREETLTLQLAAEIIQRERDERNFGREPTKMARDIVTTRAMDKALAIETAIHKFARFKYDQEPA